MKLDSRHLKFMPSDQVKYTPSSQWGRSIEDIYRKTNKNLNTGVYLYD